MMTIAVALCTYNGEEFVAAQLRSIAGQSLTVAEVVVSDDASSDDTVPIVRAELEGFEAATVIVNERPLGVVRNFEQALSATDSQLIALTDQDDVWESDKLATMATRFEQDAGLLFLHTDATLIDESGQPIGATLFGSLEVSRSDMDAIHAGDAFSVYLRRNLATGATVVLHRRLLDAALPFPQEWVHDEWLAVIAAALGGADLLERPLTRYRRHGSNQIGVVDPGLRTKICRVLQSRGERNVALASRSAVLVQRLEGLGAEVPAAIVERARRKECFERRRAGMPALRVARIPTILSLAAHGDYALYASRGNGDIIRDLLQPA